VHTIKNLNKSLTYKLEKFLIIFILKMINRSQLEKFLIIFILKMINRSQFTFTTTKSKVHHYITTHYMDNKQLQHIFIYTELISTQGDHFP